MSDKIQELKCILKNNGKENPFENKLLRMLIKALEQLQAKMDENTALKQQLDISVEALEKHCKRCSSSPVGYCRPGNCYIHIAKTALDKIKN